MYLKNYSGIVKNSKAEEQAVIDEVQRLQKEMLDRAYERCKKAIPSMFIMRGTLDGFYLDEIANYMKQIKYDENNQPAYDEIKRIMQYKYLSLADQFRILRDQFDIRLANIFLDKKSGSCETISSGAVLLSTPPDCGDQNFINAFKKYIQYRSGLSYGALKKISTKEDYGYHDVFLVDRDDSNKYLVADYLYQKYQKANPPQKLDTPIEIKEFNKRMNAGDLNFTPTYINMYNPKCPQTYVYESMAVNDSYKRGVNSVYTGKDVYKPEDLNAKTI